MIRTTALALVLSALSMTAVAHAEPKRPSFPFTTDVAYDASKVAPYKGKHAAAYAYIDANKDRDVANVQRWVRQRSISAQNDGVVQMAEMLRDDLKALGFKEAELVPTKRHPGVWGYYDAGAKTTIAVYMMYDVQPIEPTGWKVDAFAGTIVEDHPLGRVLMARGATNQKGPQRIFLNALQAIIATEKKLPVNIMLLAEGEEELGSPHYPDLIAKYADRLKQAKGGVVFPMMSQAPSGGVQMTLGVKGNIYFELEAQGGPQGGPKDAEVHSSFKAIVDAPGWRLAQALASLTSPDGNTIVVPGYYDSIRQPNQEEQELINGVVPGWTAREPELRKSLGVDKWIDGLSGREALTEYLFDTTLNIDGIWGGYSGEGTKTILPHKFTAKLDSRLVPNQTPDESERLIRAHLDAKGFTDIKLTRLSGYPPAQSSVKAPLVQATIGTYRKYGITPDVMPRLAGSAPYYVFTDILKLPIVSAGIGYGTGAHAPNEFIVIDPKPGSKLAGITDAEKFYVDLVHAVAAAR
ncbi:M20/M25/M40 family metallo-hydrolase [Sphingomonas histidinilytica]|jgi:acetylornithine deacetylase/succinyl-diaminopimelate desuccinylase-like protein|uniref:Acetylornithine deacetylase/Succinyl-diaminopimelate desuccinylase n=1 Tax=Rhizorhabdus histidinilytica TaxID=439228 RepID=A0A1T5BHN8_9SPHN|nr:M20/M25/M40 family metallo-hydrolase [Rhizorhabdus histidinilytica]MBO9379190.1 M20/M25/M40 family metallo-hydrolase [Rhizorhabdus histidinilytica]QEH77627.1 M20/M25/M40 family metallo-hydrolase [Sphingomonas sp. C8-2]SKB46333.1 Acetylornithine deacetylase/Succinyl-diaminopimelate desuccinylase [Rhizorhabdus histidinilytica]